MLLNLLVYLQTSTEDKLAWKKIVEQAKTHPGL